MGDSSDDDSDDWATDLTVPTKPTTTPTTTATNPSNQQSNINDDDNDDEWGTKIQSPSTTTATTTSNDNTNTNTDSNNNDDGGNGEPMIIVDMTKLTSWVIHSKFDANSVNDIDAVKDLRRKIEQDYEAYSKNVSYLQDRIVIPCGSSVWKDAIVVLRKEYVGHYFCPIFQPKKKYWYDFV